MSRPALAAAAALAAVLSGCFGQLPQVPEDRFYRLGEPALPAEVPKPDIDGSIAVARPYSDGLHTERAILYATAEQPLRVMRHHYDFWADSPPVLVQEHLVEFLRRAGVGDSVVRSESALDRALLIEPRLERFERMLGTGDDGDQVAVALEFTIRGKHQEPLVTGYRVRQPVRGEGMYATVQAFDAALTDIYLRLLRDLAAR